MENGIEKRKISEVVEVNTLPAMNDYIPIKIRKCAKYIGNISIIINAVIIWKKESVDFLENVIIIFYF